MERPRNRKPSRSVTEWASAMQESVDMEEGVSRLGGNGKLYLDLLLKFMTKYEFFVEELRDKLYQREYDEARRMIHTIKGLAGSLAMKGLFEMSKRLEADMLEIDRLDFDHWIEPWSQELNKVILAIRSRPPERPSTAAVRKRTGLTLSKLNDLERTLKEHNPEAIDRLKEIGAVKGYESEFTMIGKAMSVYEFDRALELVQGIKSRIREVNT